MNIDLTIYLCPDCFVPVDTYRYFSEEIDGLDLKAECPKCKKQFVGEDNLERVTQETVRE